MAYYRVVSVSVYPMRFFYIERFKDFNKPMNSIYNDILFSAIRSFPTIDFLHLNS